MKTVYAPDTMNNAIETARTWAQGNPMETYFLAVVGLMAVCYWLTFRT